MNKYVFEKATLLDIKAIAEIEQQYFSSYAKMFQEDTLKSWYIHNPSMFYVVRVNDVVSGFAILVPIKKELHEMILHGNVGDLFDFPKELVCRTAESEYYYVADACMRNLVSSGEMISLMKGIGNILYTIPKYITTLPITKYGYRMCKSIGFQKYSEIIDETGQHELFFLDATDPNIRKRFSYLANV